MDNEIIFNREEVMIRLRNEIGAKDWADLSRLLGFKNRQNVHDMRNKPLRVARILAIARQHKLDADFLLSGKRSSGDPSGLLRDSVRNAFDELTNHFNKIDEAILDNKGPMELQRLMLDARRIISRWTKDLEAK